MVKYRAGQVVEMYNIYSPDRKNYVMLIKPHKANNPNGFWRAYHIQKGIEFIYDVSSLQYRTKVINDVPI